MKIKFKNSILFRLSLFITIPQIILFIVLGYIFSLNLANAVLGLKDASFKSDLEGRSIYISEYMQRYRDYLDNLNLSYELSLKYGYTNLNPKDFIFEQEMPQKISVKHLAYIDKNGEVYSKNANIFSKKLIATLAQRDLDKFISSPIITEQKETISFLFKELRQGGYFAIAIDIKAFQDVMDSLSNLDMGVIGWAADGDANLVASTFKDQIMVLNLLKGDDDGKYTGMNAAAEAFYKEPKAGRSSLYDHEFDLVEHIYFAPVKIPTIG